MLRYMPQKDVYFPMFIDTGNYCAVWIEPKRGIKIAGGRETKRTVKETLLMIPEELV